MTGFIYVRERGLAPPRLTTHAPQACLATKLQHSRIYLYSFCCFCSIFKAFCILSFLRGKQITRGL